MLAEIELEKGAAGRFHLFDSWGTSSLFYYRTVDCIHRQERIWVSSNKVTPLKVSHTGSVSLVKVLENKKNSIGTVTFLDEFVVKNFHSRRL